MYVCMHVCMYVCMYICTYVLRMYVCMYICVLASFPSLNVTAIDLFPATAAVLKCDFLATSVLASTADDVRTDPKQYLSGPGLFFFCVKKSV